MDIHDGQHNSSSPNTPLKQNESPDPAELPRGISDVAIKHLLSCTQIRLMDASLYSTDYAVVAGVGN